MPEKTWEDVWIVERDICHLYHRLAEFAGIDGDQPYTLLYNMPYWEFFDLHVYNFPRHESDFVRDGCLVMLLAMCWDVLDGSGDFLLSQASACVDAVLKIVPCTESEEKLVHTVLLALEAVRNDLPVNDELRCLSVWVNQEYVLGYFKAMADELILTHNYAKSTFISKQS